MSRKNEIIAQATLILRRQGLAGLSMGPLAREMGMAKASLFHHFSSKEELLKAVCDELHKQIEDISLLIENQDSPDKALQTYISFHCDDCLNGRSLLDALLADLDNYDAAIQDTVQKITQADSHILVGILHEGAHKGWDLPAGLSQTAMFIQQAVLSMARWGWNNKDEDPCVHLVQNFIPRILSKKT